MMTIKSTRVLLSARMKTHPRLFLPIAHLRETSKRRAIRRDSDIVIEGYWRCGNHFATYAFEVAQARPMRIAHHFHAPAQLMLAIKWEIPAILLIREPCEAVASATVFLESENPLPLLKFYLIFYRAVLPIKSHLVVSDFPTTINDFSQVIRAVNNRYHREFELFTASEEQMCIVQERIGEEHQKMGRSVSTLPLPSEEKARRKVRVKEHLARPSCAALLEEARQVYAQLVDDPENQSSRKSA